MRPWLKYSIIFLLACMLLIVLYPYYKKIIVIILKVSLPFICAIILSYLMYPLVKKLRAYRINHGLAIGIAFVTIILLLVCIIYFSLPTLMEQLPQLNNHVINLLKKYESMIYSIERVSDHLPGPIHDRIDEFIIKLERKFATQIDYIVEQLNKTIDLFFLISLVPVITFYILKDFHMFFLLMNNHFSSKTYYRMITLIKELEKSFGGYVRGQLIVSFFVTSLTLIVYKIINLEFALALALLMGILNIIPYFGPIIGLLPALIIASSHSWAQMVLVVVTALGIQMIEGSFLSPYIMAKNIKIHPLILIFSLLLGVQAAGVIGMVLAVPTTILLKSIYESQKKLKNSNAIDI